MIKTYFKNFLRVQFYHFFFFFFFFIFIFLLLLLFIMVTQNIIIKI